MIEKKLMEAIRKIVSADLMKPVIDLPWATKGSKVEIIVFPVNQDIPSIVEKNTSDIDASFGSWADMDKTTEEICTEIRESRTFRERDLLLQ